MKNKPYIIVTGGTRTGLATAEYLSKLNWNLIIVDNSKELLLFTKKVKINE